MDFERDFMKVLEKLGVKNRLGKISLVGAVFNVYILMIMSYLMLYLHNGKYGNATPYKQQRFLEITLYTAIALLVVLIVQTVVRKLLKQPALRINSLNGAISVTSIFAAGFLLTNFICALCSPYLGMLNSSGRSMVYFGGDAYNTAARCEGLIFTLIYIVIFFLASIYGRLNNITVSIIALTMIVMAGIGMVQLLGWNIFNICYTKFYARGGGLVYVSTVGQFNIYSIAGTLLLSFCGGCFIGHKKLNIFTRALCFVAFSMGCAYHLCLDVSAGKLALVLTVILLFPYMLANPQTRKQTVTLSIGLLLAVMYKLCVIPYYPKKIGFDYDLQMSNGKEIALIIVLLIGARIALHFFNDKIRGKWVLFALYGMTGIIGAMMVYYFRYNLVVSDNSADLIKELSSLFKGDIVLTSGTYRLANWVASMEILKEFPILGSGPGTFYRAFTDYSLDLYQLVRPGYYVDLAHNDYVQYLCTLGIVGFVAYLGFIGSILVRAVRRFNKNPLVIGLSFSVVMFLIQNFFIFSLVATAPSFFIILGLLEREIRNTPVLSRKEKKKMREEMLKDEEL